MHVVFPRSIKALAFLGRINMRFVRQTFWSWLVMSVGMSLGILSFLTLISLLLPHYADLMSTMGWDANLLGMFRRMRVDLLHELDESALLPLAFLPYVLLYSIWVSKLFHHNDAAELSSAEIAVLRQLGAKGWVTEIYEYQSYELYGPAGERQTVSSFRDLHAIAEEITCNEDDDA
jgi:hypothetical protein